MSDEVRRRVLRLRNNVYGIFREHPVLGPVQEELHWMLCDGCGERLELSADKAFLDLPDQLEGWSRTSDDRDLCPSCSS